MNEIGWAAAAPATALVIVDDYDRPDPEGMRVISGPDGHHLQRVRRIESGEQVVVADGSGRWQLTRVESCGDGTVTVSPAGGQCEEPKPTPGITVAFSPSKSDHGTDVVHQLVEIGVDRIVPLVTQRSVVRWEGKRGKQAYERLDRVIRAAAVQCHRARMPVLEPPATVADLAGRRGLLVAARSGGRIEPADWPPGDQWCVAIGPEGGFTGSELDTFGSVPRIAVGPHVLRSVTAPIAVAAVLAARRAG
ncbi:MAG: RsmE family RNA methyltransferase [Acidimicrobiia bacterium]